MGWVLRPLPQWCRAHAQASWPSPLMPTPIAPHSSTASWGRRPQRPRRTATPFLDPPLHLLLSRPWREHGSHRRTCRRLHAPRLRSLAWLWPRLRQPWCTRHWRAPPLATQLPLSSCRGHRRHCPRPLLVTLSCSSRGQLHHCRSPCAAPFLTTPLPRITIPGKCHLTTQRCLTPPLVTTLPHSSHDKCHRPRVLRPRLHAPTAQTTHLGRHAHPSAITRCASHFPLTPSQASSPSTLATPCTFQAPVFTSRMLLPLAARRPKPTNERNTATPTPRLHYFCHKRLGTLPRAWRTALLAAQVSPHLSPLQPPRGCLVRAAAGDLPGRVPLQRLLPGSLRMRAPLRLMRCGFVPLTTVAHFAR
jgi:hypothetical protein